MLACPDCASLIQVFDTVLEPSSSTAAHHEEVFLQIKFQKDVLSFIDIVQHLGHPFQASGSELVTLDTQDVMEHDVARSLTQTHKVGVALHVEYNM